MRKLNQAAWIVQLEKRRDAIGAERDKLREIVEECEGLEDTCNRAHEALEQAIDALSELA